MSKRIDPKSDDSVLAYFHSLDVSERHRQMMLDLRDHFWAVRLGKKSFTFLIRFEKLMDYMREHRWNKDFILKNFGVPFAVLNDEYRYQVGEQKFRTGINRYLDGQKPFDFRNNKKAQEIQETYVEPQRFAEAMKIAMDFSGVSVAPFKVSQSEGEMWDVYAKTYRRFERAYRTGGYPDLELEKTVSCMNCFLNRLAWH